MKNVQTAAVPQGKSTEQALPYPMATPAMPDIDKLHYPTEITGTIGLSVNEIAYLKKKGCPFFGRKTTVRWVREFIARAAGAQRDMSATIQGGAA